LSKNSTLDKAYEYIRKNGSILENAKLDIIFEKNIEKSKQIILEHFKSLQNEDGGFPYQNIQGNISTINHTVSSLITLVDYGLTENLIIEKAIKFLFERQKKEGCWDEQHDLLLLNPPVWDTPENLFTQIWLTANTCHLLILLNLKYSQYLMRGIEFLLQNRTKNGKINGYLLSNWIAIAIFSKLRDSESEIVKDFISVIGDNLEKILGTSDAVWCLRCFLDGGVSSKNYILKILLEDIYKSQKSDGRWESVDGSEFDIKTTLEIVRLLKQKIVNEV